jgi:hypothetical protein
VYTDFYYVPDPITDFYYVRDPIKNKYLADKNILDEFLGFFLLFVSFIYYLEIPKNN